MYHAVGASGEPASRFVIPARTFKRQMAWLRWCGYKVLSLDQLMRHRATGEPPPSRAVVITFDDGYVDNLTLAAPVLERFGFPATVFVVTAEVGGAATWTSDPGLEGRELLSWEDLAALCDSGRIALGAHTRTHLSLRECEPATARLEIEGSLDDLRQRGFDTGWFAYPFGYSTAEARASVRNAGFAAAVGILPGRVGAGSDDYELPRYEIRGTDRLVTFAFTLAFGRRPPRLFRRGRT